MATKLKVKVTPNANSNQILGWQDDTLKIKIQAPAKDGLANAALISFLSKSWKLPKRAITILQGDTSREKLLAIDGTIPLGKQAELPF